MTYPHIAMAEGAHDRAGLHRTDTDWLAARWAEPSTRVLVIAKGRLRPVDGRPQWVSTEEAQQPGARVLLGRHRDVWHFALVLDELPEPAEEWTDLRQVLQVLSDDPDEAPLIFHAIGIANWLRATRYCPRDGAALEIRTAGHELACSECGRPQFPRTDPAVIMLVTDGEPGSPEERCLLGRQPRWPEGRFSTLAGFVEPGESLEDAVRREVAEETGVAVGEVRYFGNQPWPFPASLMLGFFGTAASTGIVVDPHEIEDARWFTRDELRAGAEARELALPGGVSISRSLIEDWYGGHLPGHW